MQVPPPPPGPAAAPDLSSGPESVAAVEATPLESLVHHAESVLVELPAEEVHQRCRDRQVDFVALVQDGRVAGLCGRAQLGFLLGSRFGFALNARLPAARAGVRHPLVFPRDTPLRDVLAAALARTHEAFYEDVVLVDGAGRLLGLIPTARLVRLQSRLVQAQLAELRRQNVELFAAGHAVRQAQALSAGLLASNAVGLALCSAAGVVEHGNARLEELLGGVVTGCALGAVVVPAERPGWDAFVRAVCAGSRGHHTRDFEMEIPGRGRRRMHVSAGWVPETSQICLCLDDVTQQRDMERHLQREEKQQLLDSLAGGVAHELNNKLTPVLGYAELLHAEVTPAQAGFVNHIRQGVVESTHIVRQLLRLAKPEGHITDGLDLGAVVREAAMMLQFQVREARAELRLVVAPEPVPVTGDAVQLKQVVMNLALNALHAMERQPAPVLTIEAGGSDGQAWVAVADNGTGIPPAILGRIFDPFFTTKGPGGTGLGLSICQSIARQHGGELRVTSAVGAGSCFTLRLPLRPAPAVAPAGAAAAAGDRPVRAHLRVLVVEDEAVIRNFLKEALRKLYDCTVDEAAHGEEALQRVRDQPYDLVLSDIRMPVMNGAEFYLRLREARPELARRLVFVTGHTGAGSLQDDIARWGVPVLAKPFTLERLGRACDERIDRAAAGPA